MTASGKAMRVSRRSLLAALGASVAAGCVPTASSPPAGPTASPASTPRAFQILTGSARFDVRAFGAKGDGQADDAAPIAAAIKAATQAQPGAVVFFPRGRYLLAAAAMLEGRSPYPAVQGIGDVPLRQPALVVLQGVRDLTLEGEAGTLLVARNRDAAVIGLSGCRNVVVRSLAVDYEALQFTQGTVAGVDEAAGSIDLRIQSTYPDPLDPRFADARTWLTVRAAATPDLPKAATGRHGQVFFNRLTDLRAIGGGLHRWTGAVRGHLTGVAAGDRFVFGARDNAHPGAVAVWFSDDCVLEGVAVHSAPVLAFAAFHDNGLVLRDCVIAPLPGTDRLLSTNADGLHSKWNRLGPTLEGCRFSGMHDDAFTFHGTGLRVLRAEGAILVVERQEFFSLGDDVAVIDQATGQTRGLARVVDVGLVRWRDQTAVRLVLDAAVPGTISWEQMGGQAALPPRLDAVTPPERRPDLIADLSAVGSGFAVRRCTFSRYNGGARVYASNGTIEDTRFEGVNHHPIQGGLELYWPEVYHARRLTIRRNQFVGNAGGTNIRIEDLLGLAARRGTALGNRDILIAENRFEGYGSEGAVFVSNAENVQIAGNDFAGGRSATPVALDLCRSVSIDAPRALAVSTTAATDMATLTLRGPVTTIKR